MTTQTKTQKLDVSAPLGGFGLLSTVAVNGTTLAYRERGMGAPVIFVHGTASDLRTWERQLPAIGAAHRAVAYSRRYARPNEDIPAGADDQMQPHVDDLASFLGAIDAAPAHLVGSSWGGFICLLTAIQHPELVRTLVLEEPPVFSLFVSTPPKPSELAPLLLRRPLLAFAILRFGARTIAPARMAFQRGDNEEAIRRFGLGVLGREGYEALGEDGLRRASENVAAMRAQLLGAGFPPLEADEVRRVAAPTLLLSGERSPALLRRLSDHLYELLPDARGLEIPGASHRMHEDNWAAVNAAILDYVDDGR